jgi:hypothetical protein
MGEALPVSNKIEKTKTDTGSASLADKRGTGFPVRSYGVETGHSPARAIAIAVPAVPRLLIPRHEVAGGIHGFRATASTLNPATLAASGSVSRESPTKNRS